MKKLLKKIRKYLAGLFLYGHPKRTRANPKYDRLVIFASRLGFVLSRPTNRTYHLGGPAVSEAFPNLQLVEDYLRANAVATGRESLWVFPTDTAPIETVAPFKPCHQSCIDDPRC